MLPFYHFANMKETTAHSSFLLLCGMLPTSFAGIHSPFYVDYYSTS